MVNTLKKAMIEIKFIPGVIPQEAKYIIIPYLEKMQFFANNNCYGEAMKNINTQVTTRISSVRFDTHFGSKDILGIMNILREINEDCRVLSLGYWEKIIET